jgi:hypothetical protein
VQPGNPNAARGFDLEPVALTNRANDPDPSAQLAWKKCEADGLIVSRLGVLDNDLGKVWQPTQPHVAVRQLRDWFAQVPYLSKLRDSQVLAKAISEALGRADAKYAIADRFDDAQGEYLGLRLGRLVEVDLNSDMVLVRRDVAEAQLAKQDAQATPRRRRRYWSAAPRRTAASWRRGYCSATPALLCQGHPRPEPPHAAGQQHCAVDPERTGPRPRCEDGADARHPGRDHRWLPGGCRERRA